MTNATAPLIAILDDEPEIRATLAAALERAGYRTLGFARAREFEAAMRSVSPQVCLVDLGLPDRDGLTLVHRLALEKGATVIIISARTDLHDRIAGLDLGADDYITKPFAPAEVVARIRARLRRQATPPALSSQARFAGWIADFDRYLLLPQEGGEAVAFSQAEGAVLRVFLESPGRLLTRAHIQEALGGAASDSFDRAIDVRISRLRGKLGEDPRNPNLIKTIYGAGYIFLADVSWE